MPSLRTVSVALVSVVAATLALSSTARASCVPTASCICPYSQFGAVVTGKVEIADGGPSLLVDSRAAAQDGGTTRPVGDRLPLSSPRLPDGRPLVAGERILALESVAGTGANALSPIGTDGQVTCVYAPSFRIPEAEAVAASLSPTCDADLRSRGLLEGECDDTSRSGCTVASNDFSAPRALHGGLMALGVIALGGAFARRRRAAVG